MSLRVGGVDFQGWTSVRIQRSIETAVGSFELTVSERFPGSPPKRIRPGDACEVWIGSERVISGFVDQVEIGLDPGTHEIAVRGRAKALDLVDCAPDLSPGSWTNVTVLDLARLLAKPFGVAVRADAPVGLPFDVVSLTPGQRAWELLEERCRYRQLLPISDTDGTIVLTRAGAARSPVALVEGANILRARASFSLVDRFSVYVVKGQSSGSDFIGPELSVSPSGTARDAGVPRFRPLVVVASSSADVERCTQRAGWEAVVRAARSESARVEVQGWTQPNGRLWPLNARVEVRSATLGIFGEMLISSVAYSLDDSGSRTELSLVRPDAFAPQPDLEVPKSNLGFDGLPD